VLSCLVLSYVIIRIALFLFSLVLSVRKLTCLIPVLLQVGAVSLS
jgi:hypothetical protein